MKTKDTLTDEDAGFLLGKIKDAMVPCDRTQ